MKNILRYFIIVIVVLLAESKRVDFKKYNVQRQESCNGKYKNYCATELIRFSDSYLNQIRKEIAEQNLEELKRNDMEKKRRSRQRSMRFKLKDHLLDKHF